MNLIDKLQNYKEKINNSQILNKELGELIGIKLFDFIDKNKQLKDKFYERAKYLENLAKDEVFIKIQDELYDKIIKILRLVKLEEVQELQQKLKDKKININLKNNPLKYLWTFPEGYEALLKKENYYRLEDDGIAPMNEQYEKIKPFFNLMAEEIIINDTQLLKKYEKLIEDYNKICYKFNKKIYSTPIEDNVKSFVEFFYFCMAFYEREEYKMYYDLNHYCIYKNNTIEKVKNFCNVVIGDLIESIAIETPHKAKPFIFEANQAPNKWKDVKIQFCDENYQDVNIYIKNSFYKQINHVDFGCYKTKDKIPDQQWEFLKYLSMAQDQYHSKNITAKPTSELIAYWFSKNGKKVSKNSCEQYVSKLSKILQTVFAIHSDKPFCDYKEKECYKSKFILETSPTLREQNAEIFINKNKGEFNDNIKTDTPILDRYL